MVSAWPRTNVYGPPPKLMSSDTSYLTRESRWPTTRHRPSKIGKIWSHFTMSKVSLGLPTSTDDSLKTIVRSANHLLNQRKEIQRNGKPHQRSKRLLRNSKTGLPPLPSSSTSIQKSNALSKPMHPTSRWEDFSLSTTTYCTPTHSHPPRSTMTPMTRNFLP